MTLNPLRAFRWLCYGKSKAAFITRYFILFGGLGTAAVGAVNQVIGTSPIACSPITGNVVCASSVSIDAQTANYSIPNTDTGYLITFNCPVDCTATLPASGSPFAVNTALTVANISNATEVPILVVGTPTNSGNNCASGCTTVAVTYTVQNTGDLLVFHTQGGGSTATQTSITDTTGNVATCAAVATQNAGAAGDFDSQWACPNTAVTGSDTFTIHFSASMPQMQTEVFELSGVVTSSPSEVTNTLSSASGTALSISTSGNPSQRGDFIFGGASANSQTITPSQPTISSVVGVYKSNAYLKANGAATYTLNWTLGTSAVAVATIAAYKAAHPISVVNLCPGSGTSIIGETTSGCTPLVAGAAASIVVNASGNYVVTYIPPPSGYGPMDDMTVSFNMALLQCREPIDLFGFNASSPIIVTIPTGLPSGCTMNMEQGGTVAAQIAAGPNMGPFESANGSGQNPTGNIHTGGQFTQSNIVIRATGGAFNFGGATAQ